MVIFLLVLISIVTILSLGIWIGWYFSKVYYYLGCG